MTDSSWWRWIRLSLDHPRACLGAVAAITAVCGAGLLALDVRTDGAAIHPTDSPVVKRTGVDRHTFVGRDRVIALLSSRPGGPRVDSREGLERVRGLQTLLADQRGVDRRRPRSLATLLDPRPEIPPVLIKEFLREIPADSREFAALVERIHASRLAEGLYLSADGRTAALYVPLAPETDRGAFVEALETWLASQRSDAFELRLTGPVLAEVTLGRAVLEDLAWLVPIMVVVMAVVLYATLGTLGAVLIPLAEVAVVLVWTIGVMGHLGIPLTLVTTILPVVLMTIAVTDEIHLLERFQARLAAAPIEASGGEPAAMRAAMEAALRDLATPIAVTSLTTSVGFLSFLSASMAPIRHFGVFTAFGILLAMALSFSFIPALVLRLPYRWFVPRRSGSSGLVERLALRRPAGAAWLGVGAVLATLPGLFMLSVRDSWLDNFDAESALVRAARDFDARFWGAYRFDVVLESEEPRYFRTPAGLRLVEELRAAALKGPDVGGVLTQLAPFEIAAEVEGFTGRLSDLDAERLAHVSERVRLIEPRIDLVELLRYDAQATRLRIFVRGADSTKARALAERLERDLETRLAERPVHYHFSGDLPVALEVVDAITTNQLRSIAWAFAGVALVLWLHLRSLGAAAMLLTPVAAAISIVFGAMAYAGAALGIATSMFAALTIGVGVDFSVHLVHAYRRELAHGAPPQLALERMLGTTGRALRWNVSVLAVGFLVLGLSALKPNHSLGYLLSGSMLACYATSLLLMPQMLRSRGATARLPCR